MYFTNLHALLCELIQSFSLNFENLDISSKKILPLHTLLSRHSSNQECSINVLNQDINKDYLRTKNMNIKITSYKSFLIRTNK